MQAQATAGPIDLVALDSLVACHDCDLLLRRRAVAPGETARCPRCGSVLARGRTDSLNRTLALTLAALVAFAIANFHSFMTFSLEGQVQDNRLISGGVPALKILMSLYVLLPLKLGRAPAGLARTFRALDTLSPWGMLEVYMLGVLVAITKLSGMASISVNLGFWAFVATMLLTTTATSLLDPRVVWDRLESAP
jgi:paraquat-inducible protein A